VREGVGGRGRAREWEGGVVRGREREGEGGRGRGREREGEEGRGRGMATARDLEGVSKSHPSSLNPRA